MKKYIYKIDALPNSAIPSIIVACKCDGPVHYSYQQDPATFEHARRILGGTPIHQTSSGVPESQKKCISIILRAIFAKTAGELNWKFSWVHFYFFSLLCFFTVSSTLAADASGLTLFFSFSFLLMPYPNPFFAYFFDSPPYGPIIALRYIIFSLVLKPIFPSFFFSFSSFFFYLFIYISVTVLFLQEKDCFIFIYFYFLLLCSVDPAQRKQATNQSCASLTSVDAATCLHST